MSRSLRRFGLTALLMALIVGTGSFARQFNGRKEEKKTTTTEAKAPGKDEKDDFGDSSAISLPRDNKLKSQIEAAADYIRDEDWVLATEILQKLVGIKEDVFAKLSRKTAEGKDAEVWTSVRAEANRLIASLPPKGLAFYQLTYGPKAAELLKEAKATNKPELLARVMRLYLHTDAGAEATDLLGTYHLDRGNFSTASRCFSLLLGRSGAEKLAPTTLFKAAYAFHQTGAAEDRLAEEQVWKLLAARTRDVKLGEGEPKSVDELRTFVSSSVRPDGAVAASDWPVYRGNPGRSAQGVGSHAFMEPRWSRSLVRNNAETGETARWLRLAEEHLRRNNQPVLSSFFPVTATVLRKNPATGRPEKTALLIYRSNWGIHAVHMRTGDLDWESPSKWSLDGMTDPRSSSNGKSNAVHSWMHFYLQQGPQMGVRPAMVFENSTVGTLSTDANFVYAVEDLQVPPPSSPLGFELNRFGQVTPGGSYSPEINDAVQHSRLEAFEIATGKLKWELGDPGVHNELSDCYFLGPPLPLGGKLYVLTERQQELRLVCIDPTPPNPRVVSVQTLATTREKMQADVTRRTEAAHLAYSEGILVCPTNAGAVLGVDLLSNSLVWAYPYREKAESNEWRPGMGRGGLPPGWVPGPDGQLIAPVPQQHWKVSAPVIVEGKVVFTAPDSRALHCVNLRDGSPLWKVQRNEDDQYLGGVYAGRVLVVGKKSVRALSLDRGETLWTVETGQPSGQGVASDNVYYLPLREAGQTKEPEICAIDVLRGQAVSHTKARVKKEVPGNLLFYEGDVISQTATEVVAFPQLNVKLAEIDALIARNPDDPVGRTERGVLLLDQGKLEGAIDDLTKALDNHPDAKTEERARAKLFETFTEYFQKDFDKAERFLNRYEELCKVPPPANAGEAEKSAAETEERRRRANFLCLVAKGKEKQGKLVEAFERYQQFGAVAGGQELISVVDEPAVRAAPDVWAQGRIAAMAAAAGPKVRKPLEERIAKRWEEVRAANDVEELRKFVAVFGALFAVGREARLALAERLIDSTDGKALVEAERHLSLLRGPDEPPAVAARAVECLARFCTRRGLLDDAAYYYHVLGTRYSGETVRDGKTGADLYNELATDKRFLPLLDSPGGTALVGKVRTTEEHGAFPYHQQVYTFEQRGEPLPFFRENQLALQYGGQMNQLRLADRATGEVRWAQTLTLTQFANLVYGNGQPNMPRFRYQTLGHLVVLPVGHLVFGVDPVGKQLLWERSLTGSPTYQQFVLDPHDGAPELVYPDGWRQRVGQTGPLGGHTVCLQTRDALVALDPVSGRTVWTRSDVDPRSHVFGDGETLYAVEMGDGGPGATKAMRASDGVSVKVPDFAAQYKKRLRVIGGTLLVSDTGPAGAPVLRLYDVRTGKDLWQETFAANAKVLQSEDPHLAGAVEPDGRVRVYDLRTHARVLDAKFRDPHELDKVTSAHLLADGRYFYVTCAEPNDPAVMPFGGVQTALMPGTGLRSLPVNGWVYCFNGDGSLNWCSLVRNQQLLLERFADLPVVIFAARYQRWAAGPVRNVQQVFSVTALEKQTGKLKYTNDNPVDRGLNFHALHVDPRAGRVDFVGNNLKISFVLEGQADAAAKPKPASRATGALAPPPDDGPRPAPRRVRRAPVGAEVPAGP